MEGIKLSDDESPVSLVAAVELLGIPADTAQDVGHCTAALPASPAQDERTPVLGVVEEMLTQVARDVFSDVGSTDFLGCERRDLLVQGADLDALGVIKHRAVDRSGRVVFGKLGRSADVDDLVERCEVRVARELGEAGFHGPLF